MDKKQTILAVLTALFIISLVYRIMNPYRQKTVSSLTYTSGKHQAAGNKPDQKSVRSPDLNAELMIDPLMNPEHQQVRMFRNIFEKNAPARDGKPSPPVETIPSREMAEGNNVPLRQAPEHQRMNQDLAQLIVFGSYESEGQKFIFLERNKDIFIVRKGDVIDGQYRVENISDHSMTFRSEIQGESVTIDISDIFTIGF